MSGELAETAPISAQTVETVLATGDLSKLTAPQRVEYVMRVCKLMGLNPFTRPIKFLRLNGEVQPYFTRDGCDQLRALHKISLHLIEQRVDAGVFVARVQAKMPSGREDEDIGAVTLPGGGESRANAFMKCVTKAKRRVTLSICGLGFVSEDELDGMPGAQVFDAGDEPPPESRREQINRDVPMPITAEAEKFLMSLQISLGQAPNAEEIHKILDSERVQRAKERATGLIKERLEEILHASARRAAELMEFPPKDAEVEEPAPAG